MRFLTLCCAAPFCAALCACTHLTIENPVLSEMPQARNDAALVFFFKRSQRYNQARKYYVYDGDEFLGAVNDGSFFFVHLAPGIHNFPCLKLGLNAGLTYYLVVGEGYQYDVDRNLDFASDREVALGNCPPLFSPTPPEYAQMVIANLSYTIIRKE